MLLLEGEKGWSVTVDVFVLNVGNAALIGLL